MKRIITTIIALCTLAVSNAYAIDPPGWVAASEILSIPVQPNGNIYIEFDADVPDLGCTGNTPGWLQMDTSAPHFKEQYSFLLASYMADEKVRFYVNHCGYFPYIQNSRISKR